MSQSAKSTRVQQGKPPAGRDPATVHGGVAPDEGSTPVEPSYPGFRVALTLWALAFAALVLYEVVGVVIKLAL